jgi:hypothetical protein
VSQDLVGRRPTVYAFGMDSNTSENTWIEHHQPDPRFPTSPEYVQIAALAQHYGVPEDQILELALVRPGTCLRSDGNPWVDHGNQDRSLFFHEPTLRAALAAKAI